MWPKWFWKINCYEEVDGRIWRIFWIQCITHHKVSKLDYDYNSIKYQLSDSLDQERKMVKIIIMLPGKQCNNLLMKDNLLKMQNSGDTDFLDYDSLNQFTVATCMEPAKALLRMFWTVARSASLILMCRGSKLSRPLTWLHYLCLSNLLLWKLWSRGSETEELKLRNLWGYPTNFRMFKLFKQINNISVKGLELQQLKWSMVKKMETLT